MSDLPSGWEWTRLENLAAAEPRSITDGPFGSNLKSTHYTDPGARVIRLQNIGDGEFRDDRAYIDLDHYERLKAHEVRAGDLVVASLGDTPPRACLMPELGAPAIVKADCIRVRLHPGVLPSWVLYALMAPPSRKHAAGLIKGVGRPRLGLAHIRAIPLPLPPLAEQHRIVERVEELLAGVDSGERSVTTAGRRLPVAIAAAREDILQFRACPGWTTGVLGDVLDRIEAGRSFGGSSRPAGPDEWGIVRVSAMTWGRFIPTENKLVPADAADPRFEIREGDILVSRANTEEYVGAPVLVGPVRPRLLLSDKSLRLVPKPGFDRRWLAHVLAGPFVRRYISRVATGTKESMRNISQAALRQTPIAIPPPAEQPRIADELDGYVDALTRLGGALREVEARGGALRRAILADAFAGRLVPQDPSDPPASRLLACIREERSAEHSGSRRSARRSTL